MATAWSPTPPLAATNLITAAGSMAALPSLTARSARTALTIQALVAASSVAVPSDIAQLPATTQIRDGGIVVSGSLTIGNTILKTGTSGANIAIESGTVTSNGYNISNDDGGGFLTGSGDQINTDPILGPLQDNGGPTFTHALLPGSPAIDAGDPNFTPPPYYDQRGPGFDRVRNGRLDVGSFEVQEPLPTPTPTATPTARRQQRQLPRLNCDGYGNSNGYSDTHANRYTKSYAHSKEHTTG